MTRDALGKYMTALTTADQEVAKAREGVLAAVEAMYADGGYFATPLRHAWLTYRNARDERERIEADEKNRRRDEHNAMVLHYVGNPGDKHTLCGQPTDTKGFFPHGWVGTLNEFYLRRVAHGGNVCPECEAVIKGG